MRDDLLPVLACPVCNLPIARSAAKQAGCAAGHRFDEARQGYLSLLPAHRRALTADTPEMVDARLRFLGRGHYAPIERAVAERAEQAGPGIVLDVGSGPGTYVARVLDAHPGRLGVALDLSPIAIRRAARAHARAGAVVGDVTERLPVVDAAAAVVLDIFAPRNQGEYARVLQPDGVLIVVTPREGHLGELASATIRVDPEKERRLRDSLTPSFVPAGREELTWTMPLSAEDVHDVVHMGPSHHHVAPDAVFVATEVTAAVTVSTWRRARSGVSRCRGSSANGAAAPRM